jgi:PhoH-like ATPase
LFRHCPSEQRIVEVRRNKDLWAFQGKNPKQQMALDLLTDDSIQLVCLIGPAGTGKTFLTLLAGLHKVIVEKMYSRLFVARPLVSLGADIGFIPGDLQEKLFHWMHPIYDNLECIFNEMREKEEFMDIVDSYRITPRRPRQGKYHNNYKNHRPHFADEAPPSAYNPTVQDSVSMLQKRGLLGLEAITYMRGRSIPKQYMFIDEAQNLSAQEIKTIISRAGEGTKVVLSGDPYQIDSPHLDFFSSGLTITSQKLKDQPLAATVLLEDSERSPLAKMAIKHL